MTANRTLRTRSLASRGLPAMLAGALLFSLVLGCREEPEPPPRPCGLALEGCGERMHCDRVAIPPRCVCDAPYVAADCSNCALGYERDGDRCEAEPIDCRDDPCGTRGECTSSPDRDTCDCDEEYAGNRCATCADGFQDNDNNGVCREACGVAPLACVGRRICSDATGVARCACPNGYTGETCSECEVGYRRLAGMPECVPTCESPDVSCTEQGTCVDGPSGAECVCLPGYAGETCDECDTTHSRNEAGDCVAPIPSDADYLTLVAIGERQYLAALSRPSFEILVIVPLARELEALAYDGENDRLYGLSQGELVRVDATTGELDTVATNPAGLGTTLAFDSSRGVLYSASESELFSIDPSDLSVSSLAARGAVAIAYDASRDRLLLLEATSTGQSSLRRLEWDAATGELSELGRLGLAAAAVSSALATDPGSGVPHLLVAQPESETDALARHCRAAARAMGVDAQSATVVGEYGNPAAAGETRSLSYVENDPPLLLYGSEGDPAEDPATLQVATQHPEAIVCIVTREQPLEVVVQSDAKLRLLIVSSWAGNVTVTAEAGFTPPVTSPQPIRTHYHSGAEPNVADDLHVHYDADGWAALGLAPFSTADSLRTVSEFGPLDWEVGASALSALDTQGAELVGALTEYSPGL